MTPWFFLTTLAVLSVSLPDTAAGLSGHYVECRDCDVYTGPCFANAEMNLRLEHTSITDAGLAHLEGLDRLVALDVTFNPVTAKGVEGLAKALPKCMIKWNGGVISPR